MDVLLEGVSESDNIQGWMIGYGDGFVRRVYVTDVGGECK